MAIKLRRYQLEYLAQTSSEILREKTRQAGSSLELGFESAFRGSGVWFLKGSDLLPDSFDARQLFEFEATKGGVGATCPDWALGHTWQKVAYFTGDPRLDVRLTDEQIEYVRQCSIDDGHPDLFIEKLEPESYWWAFDKSWAQDQIVMHIKADEAKAWVDTYLVKGALPEVMPTLEKLWGRTAKDAKPRKNLDDATGERVWLPSGRCIRTLATNSLTAQGPSGDVYWDEAALPHRNVQNEIFDTLSKMTTLGQRMVLSSRHNGNSLFHERIGKANKGEIPAAVVKVTIYDAILQGASDIHGKPLDPKALAAKCSTWEDYEEQYLCLVRRTGQAVLPGGMVDALIQAAVDPIGYLDEQARPVQGNGDWLSLQTAVWEFPQPGVSYVLSVDIALGRDGALADANRTVFTVWRVDESRLVARCAGFTPLAKTTARICRALGEYYNWAFLAPERNNHGESVLERLCDPEDDRCFYPMHLIYSWMAYGSKQLPRVGWPTNKATRGKMMDGLCQWLTDNAARWDSDAGVAHVRRGLYPDRFMCEELRDLVYDGKGEKKGEPYDDTICAAAIALAVIEEHREFLLARTDLGGTTVNTSGNPWESVVEIRLMEDSAWKF